MSTFTEDFQRRLRAVLALRSAAPIPSDAVIEIETDYFGSTDDTGGLDLALKIRTADFRAVYRYDEPGAWGKLLADLEAVDAPAPLKRDERERLLSLRNLGGQRLLQKDPTTQSLAARGYIDEDRVTRYWYITQTGRDAVADETDQVVQSQPDDFRRIVSQGRKNSGGPDRPRTALDVIDPLSPAESDLLVKIHNQGPQRLIGDGVQSGLAERGLVYPKDGYWHLTVLGRDAAAEIKAAAVPTPPPLTLVRAERIPGDTPPAMWFGYDELGTKYYMQFLFGRGKVEAWTTIGGPHQVVREFTLPGVASGSMTLGEFAGHAGIDVSQIPEEQRR